MTEEITIIQTRKHISRMILHISKAIMVNGIFNALRLELKGNKI